VLTIHDLNPVHEGFRSPASLNKYLNRLGGYIDACDKIVAISKFVASDIEKYFPQAKDKITVIYNGADKSFVPVDHKPVYDPQEKFLFAIGHISAKKNFHVLPALLAGNNYKLVISGILTDYQDKIIQEAEKFNCTDRVIITGPVNDDDKVWYYKNCEAFVFPSLAEGFGLPVIEAMHFGKPVFLSTSTSLPEVGGDVAYYFNSFEPEKMQQVLREGLQDFYLNQRTAAIKKHAEKFSWKKTAEQYLNLYQQCLK
jgi:glycosyltransferase involved in cell wall biosynthesis